MEGGGGVPSLPVGAAFRIVGLWGPFRSTLGGCWEECPPRPRLPHLWPQDRVCLKVGLDTGQSGENLLFQEMLHSESGLGRPSAASQNLRRQQRAVLLRP